MTTILIRSSTRASGTQGNFTVTLEENKYQYVKFLRCWMPVMASAPLYVKLSAVSGSDNGIVDPSLTTWTNALTIIFNDTTNPVNFTDLQAKKYIITDPALNSGTMNISVTDIDGNIVDPSGDWYLLLEFC